MQHSAHARTAKSVGTLRVDLLALRKALGRRAELLESAEAKATGHASANAAILWKHLTTSTYQSGDLVVLAVREALQNAVDAIRSGVKARKTKAGEGRFLVTWDNDSRTLSYEDNGIGMDETTIQEKFLVLGESGKGSALNSAEAAGGFGVAKAVILGVGETFRWELHTRNNRAVANGAQAGIPIYDAPYLQGTKITVRDIPVRLTSRYDPARLVYVEALDRIRELLGANDLDGIELLLNGAAVPRLFSRRAGSVIASGGLWGPGTSATVKAHRRGPGDRTGAYYVRLNGLFMFKKPAYRGGSLRTDVVIDLNTTVRPGAEGYPLTAARDQFQGDAHQTFRNLAGEIERESETTGKDLDDEIFDPDSDDGDERRGGDEIAGYTAEAFADPDFQEALRDAVGGLADFYRETGSTPSKTTPPSSAAPPGSQVDPPSNPPKWAATGEIPDDAAGMIRAILGSAELNPGEVVTPEVERVLERHTRTGQSLDAADVQTLLGAVERANDAALDTRGGGLLQVVAVSRALDAISQIAEVQPPRPKSPFGRFAGLRVSAVNYDKSKARKFRKNFASWIPFLTVWDATLRLISAEARMRWRFKPGFVLNDEVYGLTSSSLSAGAVVSVHPDRLKQVVKAHRERPFGIAGFLHALGCHELTHLDGRMGDGHDESFVSAREDLAFSTSHLLPAIAVLATRVLKLPTPKADLTAQRALERRLAEAHKSKDAGELARLRRELRAVKAELAAAARASDAAAPIVADACGTCRACADREREEEIRSKIDTKLQRIFSKLKANPPKGYDVDRIDAFERRRRKFLLDELTALALAKKPHQPTRRGPWLIFQDGSTTAIRGNRPLAGVQGSAERAAMAAHGFEWVDARNRYEHQLRNGWSVGVTALEALTPNAQWEVLEPKVLRTIAKLAPGASGWSGPFGPRPPSADNTANTRDEKIVAALDIAGSELGAG